MIHRQKSFSSNNGKLYLVATPIGNLEDMTFRAVRILAEVDYIYAEDTRVTKKLLSHFQITTPLRSYHMFNEQVKCDEIISFLQENKQIALVSDAGLPGISDPGYYVTKEAIEQLIDVIVIPGASAATTALVASGLVIEPYLYIGFLHAKQSKRIQSLVELKDRYETMIFYESIHRLKQSLEDMLSVFGNRSIALARELTKKHEEIIRCSISEVIPIVDELKGEFVVVVSGKSKLDDMSQFDHMTLLEHYTHYENQGLGEKDILKKIASDKGVSKSEIYKQYLTTKKKRDD
jgi:16S rRNA (cytidine1402-2'-O)-methyltransferase